jgi:hypothetical protein
MYWSKGLFSSDCVRQLTDLSTTDIRECTAIEAFGLLDGWSRRSRVVIVVSNRVVHRERPARHFFLLITKTGLSVHESMVSKL